MNQILKTWPERIYLTHGDSEAPAYTDMPDGTVSWADSQIEEGDIAYVRADLASTASTAEARIHEALLMLDDATAAANSTGICEADLLNVIDFAIQKLRPVPAPVHDAAALARLEQGGPKAQGLRTCATCWCDERHNG
jgi:hypothetical protein